MLDFDGNILSYGAIGLGLALAILSYRLMVKEQNRPRVRGNFLRAIYVFQFFSILIFSAGVLLELKKYPQQADQSVLEELKSDNNRIAEEKASLKKSLSTITSENKQLSGKYQNLLSQAEKSRKQEIAYENEITQLNEKLADYQSFDPFKSPNQIIEKLPEDVRKHNLDLSMKAIDEIVVEFNKQLEEVAVIKNKLESMQAFENDFLYRILVFHKEAGKFGDTLNLTHPAHEDKIWLADQLLSFFGEIGFYNGNEAATPRLAREYLIEYQKAKGFRNPSGHYGKEVLRFMIADYYHQDNSVVQLVQDHAADVDHMDD